jgi:mannose-1-phosphate guanylyltransferase
LRGDALPKQFVPFFGEPSLFERTVSRAETLVPSDRLFTVVGRHHLAFPDAARQLASRPPCTVIVQPRNRETCPGILLPLAHVAARDPDAIVVIFPSDHFIPEETRFMGYVDTACRAVERDPNRLILVGAEPSAPESEFGYMVPGRRAMDETGDGVRAVVRFVEKPGAADAERLIRDGALWNTFVMVVRPNALFDLVQRVSPLLYQAFSKIRQAIGTSREQAVAEAVYRTLDPVNFSKGVLEHMAPDDPLQVAVIPARGVFWNDWGSEQRVLADWNMVAPSGAGRSKPRQAVAADPMGPSVTWAETA